MAQAEAPDVPRSDIKVVDIQTGQLTQAGVQFLDQLWRQIAAGFVVVPCVASGTNLITLTPRMHKEGGRTYADHEVYAAVAAATSTASVTAKVGELSTIKVFKDDGATQAGNNDILINRFYLWCYVKALDGGAGGLVLK